MASDKDLHSEAMEAYRTAIEYADENRNSYLEDFRFSRCAEQWPEEIRKQRNVPGRERPMLTINKLPAFGRQVVNDIRQNRPQVKIRPIDNDADVETALVLSGLIRNIQNTSNADVAHDTAAECSVFGGFGYWRIDIDYAYEDSFEQDIRINRIANPLSVVADPYSTAADSSDWNFAFVATVMTKDEFEAEYPEADPISFDTMDDHVRRHWTDGDDIVVAEYWKRERGTETIVKLSDRRVLTLDEYLDSKNLLDAIGITAIGQREIRTHKVKQCILNGQQVLTKRRVLEGGKNATRSQYDWPGKYIPIIPCYGDEINIEGERLFHSLIHDAIDAQRQFNYWETTATELLALAPRVPWIGRKGTFATDKNWETANTQNHPYLEYDTEPPQRQPLDPGPAIGAISQAKQASDNMKAIMGLYDASLGARSNETSGRAIMARQREGDVSTFHFVDNLNRAIRHEGVVLLDLIPHIYTGERIVRVLGDDGAAQNVKLGDVRIDRQQQPVTQFGGVEAPGAVSPYPQGAPPPRIGALQGVFDLGLGKYDVAVEAGPSFTTQRQETAAQIGEFLRAFPQAAPVVGDILVKNFDWKDADEIARRLHKLLPAALRDEAQSPEMIRQQQQIAALTQQLQKVMAELEKERAQSVAVVAKAQTEQARTALERARIPIEQLEQQINLLTAQKELLTAEQNLGKSRAEMVASINDEVNEFGPAIVQTLTDLRAAVMQPRHKRGRAVKVNGAWELESMEEIDTPSPGPMVQ